MWIEADRGSCIEMGLEFSFKRYLRSIKLELRKKDMLEEEKTGANSETRTRPEEGECTPNQCISTKEDTSGKNGKDVWGGMCCFVF